MNEHAKQLERFYIGLYILPELTDRTVKYTWTYMLKRTGLVYLRLRGADGR